MIEKLKIGDRLVLQDIVTNELYTAHVNELGSFIRLEFRTNNNPCWDTSWPWFADQGNNTLRRVGAGVAFLTMRVVNHIPKT